MKGAFVAKSATNPAFTRSATAAATRDDVRRSLGDAGRGVIDLRDREHVLIVEH